MLLALCHDYRNAAIARRANAQQGRVRLGAPTTHIGADVRANPSAFFDEGMDYLSKSLSLVAQSHYWIDPGRAPRGEIAGHEGDRREKHRNCGESDRVGRAHSIE